MNTEQKTSTRAFLEHLAEAHRAIENLRADLCSCGPIDDRFGYLDELLQRSDGIIINHGIAMLLRAQERASMLDLQREQKP